MSNFWDRARFTRYLEATSPLTVADCTTQLLKLYNPSWWHQTWHGRYQIERVADDQLRVRFQRSGRGGFQDIVLAELRLTEASGLTQVSGRLFSSTITIVTSFFLLLIPIFLGFATPFVEIEAIGRLIVTFFALVMCFNIWLLFRDRRVVLRALNQALDVDFDLNSPLLNTQSAKAKRDQAASSADLVTAERADVWATDDGKHKYSGS